MLDGRNRRIQPSSDTWPMASPTEMITAVMRAAVSPMTLRVMVATASAICDAFSARNRWIEVRTLPLVGGVSPSSSMTGRRTSPIFARIAAEVIDEGDCGIDDRDDGRRDDDERDDRGDHVGDRDRDTATAERQVALDERHRRLEDVGHQPRHEQDDGRFGEDREHVGVQGDDRADEDQDDQPEDQAGLTP